MAAKDYNVIRVESDGTKYAICPPHGDTFPVNSTSVALQLDDRIYYFCSNECKETFDSDPRSYLRSVDVKLAEAREHV